jgi:hypothetical protein
VLAAVLAENEKSSMPQDVAVTRSWVKPALSAQVAVDSPDE